MPEVLTFANYSIEQHGFNGIYAIGQGGDFDRGVVQEMADTFGHELSDLPSVANLGELMGTVGPEKELQKNIAHVKEVLGDGNEAIAKAQSWVDRSGLLLPVERSFKTADPIEGKVDVAVITGGVRNWMMRRAERLVALHDDRDVSYTLLVGGNRVMGIKEGDDVEEGMTEIDYLRDVMANHLSEFGLAVEIVPVDSPVGDEVMAVGARAVQSAVSRDALVAVVSNAGAWVQNSGQFRRALQLAINPAFDHDGQQLLAVSDSFPVGTGSEPTATHQNPFSAPGQIIRNLQELVRHNGA